MDIEELRQQLTEGVLQPESPPKPVDVFTLDEPCGYSGCDQGPTASVSSMTAYNWDGEGEDPNRNLILCKEHAKEHEEHMQEQWAEYYSGLL